VTVINLGRPFMSSRPKLAMQQIEANDANALLSRAAQGSVADGAVNDPARLAGDEHAIDDAGLGSDCAEGLRDASLGLRPKYRHGRDLQDVAMAREPR
jgi:hypothetical protein